MSVSPAVRAIVGLMADDSRSIPLGFVRASASRVAGRVKASPEGDGDPETSRVGGSDLLQDVLDEVGRQNPELSNG